MNTNHTELVSENLPSIRSEYRFTIFFADDHVLVRGAVTQILQLYYPNAEIFESDAYGSLLDSIVTYRKSNPTNGSSNPQGLIITDLNMPGMHLPKSIAEISTRFPEYAIIVLSGMFNARDVSVMMDYGVRALIPKTAKPTLLAHVIGLVRDGERYFPMEMLGRPNEAGVDDNSVNPQWTLTAREKNVANRVSEGLTNKEIGRVLNLTEGTVKVVVKGIFRKMKVSNRTLLAKAVHDFHVRNKSS